MIFEFKTARDKYGHRKYLAIDTGAEIFSTQCRRMIPEGIEIKKKDYDYLVETAKFRGLKEVDFVCQKTSGN